MMEEKLVKRRLISCGAFVFMLLFLAFCTGCVSQRVPKKFGRASRKMEKHLDAVKSITSIHPGLVDSVDKPIEIDVTMIADSISSTLKLDSAALLAEFDSYDRQIRIRDSLINLINSRATTERDSIIATYQLINLNKEIQKQRFTVVESVFKDTTVISSKTFSITVGNDTIDIFLNLITTVKNGIPLTTARLDSVSTTVIVEDKHPIFTVIKKTKLPWWMWAAIFVALALVILNRLGKLTFFK